MASPKIDDQYWFDLSDRLVSGARDARDVAAQKLQAFAAWAWTAFVAATGFGVGLAGKQLSNVAMVVIGATSITLITVYWLATQAQIPRTLAFDPRMPDAIRDVFEKDVQRKSRFLTAANWVGAAASIFVCASFAVITSTVAATASGLSPAAVLWLDKRHQASLAVSGTFDTESAVSVNVLIDAADRPQRHIAFPVIPILGRIQTVVPIAESISLSEKLTIIFEWTSRSGVKFRASITPIIGSD